MSTTNDFKLCPTRYGKASQRLREIVLAGTCTLLLCSSFYLGAWEESTQQSQVLEVMATHIVPASTSLWEFDVPVPTDQWAVFEKAAEQLVEGADLLKEKALGSTGVDWALEADWQQYLKEMREAGEAALQAAKRQDLEAFEEAGYAAYPPCESCHNSYNPGVMTPN